MEGEEKEEEDSRFGDRFESISSLILPLLFEDIV